MCKISSIDRRPNLIFFSVIFTFLYYLLRWYKKSIIKQFPYTLLAMRERAEKAKSKASVILTKFFCFKTCKTNMEIFVCKWNISPALKHCSCNNDEPLFCFIYINLHNLKKKLPKWGAYHTTLECELECVSHMTGIIQSIIICKPSERGIVRGEPEVVINWLVIAWFLSGCASRRRFVGMRVAKRNDRRPN